MRCVVFGSVSELCVLECERVVFLCGCFRSGKGMMMMNC